MKHAAVYLNFDGDCRDAMTFYHQSLGGELHTMPFPGPDGTPSTDPAARLMHANLTKAGVPLVLASDTPVGGPMKFTPGNNFSVMLECDSIAEIDSSFAALSQGGEVRMPLGDQFWGARFGMLVDKFGIQWMFNFTHPKS